ncbi:MAG: glycosyltransferase family 2 protein, partial [Chloroflexi bacterium]|nr:glycosyltransferase family 2 protein [Chloroflexota bacterium]
MTNHPLGAAKPRVSVLMPTFQQSAFLRRALESLCAQTLADWELVIVDDGSTDDTHAVLQPYLVDQRIRYQRLDSNQGLGAALNHALDLARADLIAYLPSDDVYYPEHLAQLAARLADDPSIALAYGGVRHHYNRFAEGQIEGFALQLVQVMHRRTSERWIERAELVTDDLERMFWSRLRQHGTFADVAGVTCEWVDHPHQRYKIIRETLGGGINPYRV